MEPRELIEEVGDIKEESTENHYQILPFKNRKPLSPAKLAVLHVRRFLQDDKLSLIKVTKSSDLGQNISDNIVFFTFYNKEYKEYIHVFYPTADNNNSDEETISLKHALRVYKQSLELNRYKADATHKLTIPVYSKELGPEHWLELFINFSKGTSQGNLKDSTNLLLNYPHKKYIQQAVSELGVKELLINYSGRQSETKDSGYFFLENSACSLEKKSKITRVIDEQIYRYYEINYALWCDSYNDKFHILRDIPADVSHAIDPETVPVEWANLNNTIEITSEPLKITNIKPKEEVKTSLENVKSKNILREVKKQDENFPRSYTTIWNQIQKKNIFDAINCNFEAAYALLADYSKITQYSSKYSSLKLFFSFHWNRHHVATVTELLTSKLETRPNNVVDLLEALHAKLAKKNIHTLPLHSDLGKRIRFIQEATGCKVFSDQFFIETRKEGTELDASFLKYRRTLN